MRFWFVASAAISSFALLSATSCSAAEPHTSMVAATPFEMNQGRPIVQLMIDGKGPFPFILDTGASGIIVSDTLAGELGLTPTGKVETGSPIGEEPILVDQTSLASISLAGVERTNVEALIIPLPLDEVGVIGPAVFADEGRFQIDFAKGEVQVGGAVSDAADINWIPFGSSAPLLDVPVRIGDVEIMAHLDTGAPGALAVPQKWADQLPLLGPVQVVGKARTVDREFEIRAAPTDAIARFGNAELPLRDLMFFDVDIANLGSDAMHGLTIEYDFAGERFSVRGKGEAPRGGPRRVVVAQAPKEN